MWTKDPQLSILLQIWTKLKTSIKLLLGKILNNTVCLPLLLGLIQWIKPDEL